MFLCTEKTDRVSFKTFISEAASDILSNFQDKSVEEIWSALKSYFYSDINKFIPVKKFGSKRSLPSVTQEIKRLIRKGTDYTKSRSQLVSGKDNTSKR